MGPRRDRSADPAFSEVARVNGGLAPFESVKRFAVIPNELSIDSGTLTPTGKIRRRETAARFAHVVDALYEGVTTDLAEIS